MSEPLLSAEETDALLAAMQQGEELQAAEGIDLTSPERRIRTALTVADKGGEAIAGMARRLFLRHAGVPAKTDAAPAEINPYSVAAGGVRPGCALAHLRIGESFGFLALGPSLVTFLLERQLGAPLRMDDAAPQSSREELTAVERRLLRPITEELVASISDHLCGDPETIRIVAIHSNASELPTLPSHHPVLRLSVQVSPGAAPPDELTLVFASEAVSLVFAAPNESDSDQGLSASERRRIRQRAMAADVEVVAVLGRAKATVRSVLNLEVGDVLRLDTVPGNPCRLVVADTTVLHGKPVTRHGNLAIEITGRKGAPKAHAGR
ncbi:MAG: FliM/FliN family flagellar motor switch protein [Myxococcota bacterium]